MANRYVVGAPEFVPVPLSALKALLKIQNSAQDDALAAALADAADLIERYTARYLAQREVVAHVDVMELGDATMGSPFAWLKRAPVFDDAVSAVVFDNVAVPGTDWRLKISGEQAQVHLLRGVPTMGSSEVPYPMKVTFKAGYKAEADIPGGLRRAVLELAAHLHANPGDCGSCGDIPKPIKAKLSMYTIRRVFA
jgi:uncharacterized phiE125 gp8 family phage protein